jgi:hypothetical protein
VGGLGVAEANHTHCMDFFQDATELHKQYISMEIADTANAILEQAGRSGRGDRAVRRQGRMVSIAKRKRGITACQISGQAAAVSAPAAAEWTPVAPISFADSAIRARDLDRTLDRDAREPGSRVALATRVSGSETNLLTLESLETADI